MLSIDKADVEGAKDILLSYIRISACDAVHLAVMRHHDISRIMSFDRGLDVYPGLQRLY